MNRTKTIEINKREKLFLEFMRKGNMTAVSAIWVVNENPIQGWTGVAHRNPIDSDNVYRGMALAVYRLVGAAIGEIAGVMMRDKQLRNLFLAGQNYALNGYVE